MFLKQLPYFLNDVIGEKWAEIILFSQLVQHILNKWSRGMLRNFKYADIMSMKTKDLRQFSANFF